MTDLLIYGDTERSPEMRHEVPIAIGAGPLPAHLPIEIDLWPRDETSGCWADMTRKFVVGSVTDEVAALHAVVLEAVEAVRALIRPGVSGRALYDAAAEVIERAGHPTLRTRVPGEALEHGFCFSLGHGVGLDLHEAPRSGSRRSTRPSRATSSPSSRDSRACPASAASGSRTWCSSRPTAPRP